MNRTEYDNLVELIQLEQTFRVKLHLFKELTEFRLKMVQELKPLAERLQMRKHELKGALSMSKEEYRDLFNAANRKFKGGLV